jgi:metal-responsive CopG/Arc/MetJ family transcriptional regulator
MTIQNIISLPMPVDLEAQASDAAAVRGISRSELIRQAVIKFLEAQQ